MYRHPAPILHTHIHADPALYVHTHAAPALHSLLPLYTHTCINMPCPHLSCPPLCIHTHTHALSHSTFTHIHLAPTVHTHKCPASTLHTHTHPVPLCSHRRHIHTPCPRFTHTCKHVLPLTLHIHTLCPHYIHTHTLCPTLHSHIHTPCPHSTYTRPNLAVYTIASFSWLKTCFLLAVI